jgi:hypothetical protein
MRIIGNNVAINFNDARSATRIPLNIDTGKIIKTVAVINKAPRIISGMVIRATPALKMKPNILMEIRTNPTTINNAKSSIFTPV